MAAPGTSSAKVLKKHKTTKRHIPHEKSKFQSYIPERIPKAISVNIVSREVWGTRQATNITLRVTAPVNKIVLAYTDTDECTTTKECRKVVRAIQLRTFKEGFDDIRYNFVVGNDGNVYEGRGWNTCPDLPDEHRQYNKTSLFIAVCGRVISLNPTNPTLKVREDLIKYGVWAKLIDKAYSRIYLSSI